MSVCIHEADSRSTVIFGRFTFPAESFVISILQFHIYTGIDFTYILTVLRLFSKNNPF